VEPIGHCIAEIVTRCHNWNLSIATEHPATQIALRLSSRGQVKGGDVYFLVADSPVSSIVHLVIQEKPDLVGLFVMIEEYRLNAASTVKAARSSQ
jgi:hypothetical protein